MRRIGFASWFPWRLILRRLARANGFIDPLTTYARLQRFAQPAEVAEPVELLRAGVIFHARGLVNSRAIQHNLDWVWPYWVERQFDPRDVSFLPRAFSLTHVNLTHRNWTAVGLPGRTALPIVDPRGLVTPFWDGWSLDVWMLGDDGSMLLPSRAAEASQRQLDEPDALAVETVTQTDGMRLVCDARLLATSAGDVCRLTARGRSDRGGWLIVALRPANPEGVSFIDRVQLDDARRSWTIDDRHVVRFDQPVQRHHASRYHDADVFVHLDERAEEHACECPVGLVTAAAMFRIEPEVARLVHVDVPIGPPSLSTVSTSVYRRRARTAKDRPDAGQDESAAPAAARRWIDALDSAAPLSIPDDRAARLYQSALRTLVLCTPGDVWAGPYTYKRFWYRDAVFIGHGLLLGGLVDRAEALVQRFPEHQSRSGYYHSQEGEWDANGEVLWLTERLYRFVGRTPAASLWQSLRAGADWIGRKRLPDYGGQAHEGLMPAGFSAEHLGPNDHYYWDNAWSVAGLEAATLLADAFAEPDRAARYRADAEKLRMAIERSLTRRRDVGQGDAIPAAPSRRLDAGAIGSVAFSYPLQQFPARDTRMLATLDHLLEHCFHDGGFFQDMIHSGVNAYLTLHVAQALLRAGDERYAALMERVAELASPTGHWPEAVHPHTGGGCMGDGHHAWAAAEWVAMIRYAFMREEGDELHLATGLPMTWLQGNSGQVASFGPAPTAHGRLRVDVEPLDEEGARCRISWHAEWHTAPPVLVIAPTGHRPVRIESDDVRPAGRTITSRDRASCTPLRVTRQAHDMS